MTKNFEWNDAQIATCIRMHLAGDSASTIGKHLNVTRNAVIDKLTRLKASGRCPPLSNEMTLRKAHARKITSTVNAKRKKSITPKPHSFGTSHTASAPKPSAPKLTQTPSAPSLVLVRSAGSASSDEHAAPLRHLRRSGCRYITEDFALGNGDEAVMCGEQQAEGSSFCAYHKAITLAPLTNTVRRSRWRGTVRVALYCVSKAG